MKKLWMVAALVLAAPVSAEEPPVLLFRDFEATCRLDGQEPPIDPECAKGVLSGWRQISGYPNGQCDWHLFWDTVDAARSEPFEYSEWQAAVQAIFYYGPCVGDPSQTHY